MIQQLCEVLAKEIEAANLVTVSGGLATVWKSNDTDKKNKAAYWNYDKGKHELLLPDADRAAITYFEERSSTIINTSASVPGKYKADLVLIGWANTLKGIITPILIEELQQVFKGAFSRPLFAGIKVTFTELLPENEQLFSRYQYDTGIKKYLQKPYDAFGLRMTVSFSLCKPLKPPQELYDDGFTYVLPLSLS